MSILTVLLLYHLTLNFEKVLLSKIAIVDIHRKSANLNTLYQFRKINKQVYKNLLTFVNIKEISFSSFFIVALSCLSSHVFLKFAFDFILILLKNSCNISCITCARQETRFTSCTFVSTSSNIRLIRNKRFSFVCMIKLLKTLSFVTAYNRSFNSCCTTTFCIDWPQGWVSDMSDSPTRSNPRVGQKILSDGSGRVLAIVRRPNPTREIVRNLRLDKIR
jgi:hypothetical protein